MENRQEDGVTDTIENTEYSNDKSSNMKEVKIKDIKGADVEHLDVITCKFEISIRHLIDKLAAWKEARKETVKSLRELADYLDNVGSLANVVVAVRGNVLNRGIAVGGGIITFAFGISIPFLIAGAGIGLASFISRVVGVGGGLIGTFLGVVGGVLTVATAGAALPVVVAGAGLWFASGIVRWVGAGGGLIARGITWIGGAVMVLTASTATVVCLCGAGLMLAVPAITREILGSGYVETVNKDIKEDLRVTGDIVTHMNNILDEYSDKEHCCSKINAVKQAISGKIIVFQDGSQSVWDVKELQSGMKKLVQDWKEGSSHLRVIADQLEEVIGMVSENDLEFCND